MFNEDYLENVIERFRPAPDNLKLILVTGAAFFSLVIFILLTTIYYWDGGWHLKTPTGENISHSESHTTDPAKTHTEAPAEKH